MTPVDQSAPTNSLGKLIDTGYLPSWGILAADDLEDNKLLKFPESIRSFQKMRTEPQLQGLEHGATWPIYRMRWHIQSHDAKPEWVERAAMDYGLPIDDDDAQARKTKNRFKFLEHLEQALEACFLGFQVFEQKMEYRDSFLHLRKLLPLPPQTIVEWDIADDGGVNWIAQQQGPTAPKLKMEERLLWYAFQKRNANWFGRSLLRGCYGPWLLKDRAVRVGVMNIQRAGVGTPVIEGHPGATEPELIVLNRLAERFKAGERSGGALPAGAKLRLVGVEGSQPDTVGFIKLMNEEMARAFLEMFMMAGQTGTGTRNTAETHVDFHKLTLEYIANWFAGIFNEHMIEDDWEWNYGEKVEEVPKLGWEWDEAGVEEEKAAEAAEDPAAELRRQVNDGTVQVDEEVAAALGAVPGSTRRSSPRRRRGGTARAAGTPPVAVPPLLLPGRPLRRQPYAHEVTAAVDFAEIDTSYQSTLDLLVQELRILQAHQVAELHDDIIDADGDMAALSQLAATPVAQDVIRDRLRVAAGIAAEQARGEAVRQGVSGLPRPDVDDIVPQLEARAGAVDNILSTDLSTSASREAVRLSGGGLSPAEVAEQVRNHLLGRTDAYLRDLLGGAVQQAINDGRGMVIQKADPRDIYATELLDSNTCTNCVGRDGTHYQNWGDAARDYPSGGYKNCLGRERCRGFLVAVYDETPATLGIPFGGAV